MGWAGDHVTELVIKPGEQQEALSPRWKEENATHSVPGNGPDSGSPLL